MSKFTVIPQDTFESLQLDAGVLLKSFDPSSVVVPKDSDIICATTGGINASCTPTYSDMGEDVDNCPANVQYSCQLKRTVAILTRKRGFNP